MNIEGIDLDISPFTLEEWSKLVPDLEQAIRGLMTETKDFNHQIPVGYKRNADDPRLGDPIKEDIYAILQLLDRVRFQEVINVSESIPVFKSKGIPLQTVQSIQNLFDRIEESLGFLPPLPPSVDKKAKNNRERLNWRRKRRIAKRQKDKKAKLVAERKRLDLEISKETKRRVQDAKQSKMTLEEMKGESIEDKVKRLKSESKDSRFQESDVEVNEDQVVLFKPTPKQAEFLAAPEKVVFYGGFQYLSCHPCP